MVSNSVEHRGVAVQPQEDPVGDHKVGVPPSLLDVPDHVPGQALPG